MFNLTRSLSPTGLTPHGCREALERYGWHVRHFSGLGESSRDRLALNEFSSILDDMNDLTE